MSISNSVCHRHALLRSIGMSAAMPEWCSSLLQYDAGMSCIAPVYSCKMLLLQTLSSKVITKIYSLGMLCACKGKLQYPLRFGNKRISTSQQNI